MKTPTFNNPHVHPIFDEILNTFTKAVTPLPAPAVCQWRIDGRPPMTCEEELQAFAEEIERMAESDR